LLSIQNAVISPIVSSVLCEGLSEAPSDQSSDADAVSHLVTGLQNNKNLKILSFHSFVVFDRGGFKRIIKAL
jgi:hypothetical protein